MMDRKEYLNEMGSIPHNMLQACGDKHCMGHVEPKETYRAPAGHLIQLWACDECGADYHLTDILDHLEEGELKEEENAQEY